MQTILQVHASKAPSLRSSIENDRKLANHGLIILREKTPGRKPGWAKLRSTDLAKKGTINLEWDADTGILTCRIVNRATGRPDSLAGDFVSYLLARHSSRIRFLLMILDRSR
jgi:hypothetical protein